jgi:hypothetical protein
VKKKQIAELFGWRKGDHRDVFHGRPMTILDGKMAPTDEPSTYWVRIDGLRWGWAWILDDLPKKEFARLLRELNDSLSSQQAVAPESFHTAIE